MRCKQRWSGSQPVAIVYYFLVLVLLARKLLLQQLAVAVPVHGMRHARAFVLQQHASGMGGVQTAQVERAKVLGAREGQAAAGAGGALTA